MRSLIIADLHSNLEAFQAILKSSKLQGGFDQVWVLGDLVGYGPDPGPCIDLLRSLPHVAICGNHDLAAISSISLEKFNPIAAKAASWTTEQLTTEQKKYLGSLPKRTSIGEFTLVHGSPLDPIWDYFLPGAMDLTDLQASFDQFSTRYCLVGHSHLQFWCGQSDLEGPGRRIELAFRKLTAGDIIPLGNERLVINPGSAGQPRDGDPRVSYLLYDAEANHLVYFRTSYDVETVQKKMRQAGLSENLVTRLSTGQ
jgi:diadenosine tetraphosphatase ApaH/serine/threonine PP2A family protein phosphatase